MMITVSFVLLIAALMCFVLAAIGIGAGRLNLVALGLACWLGSELL